MIKIKPFVKLGYAPDVIFAMTENRVERLSLDYKPLLDTLQSAEFNSQALSDDDLERLRQLDTLKLIYNTSQKYTDLVSSFEFNGWRESYVINQLECTRVAIHDFHSDPSWAVGITNSLGKFGLTLDNKNPTINVLIVERLNQLDDAPYPAIPVKIGSYITSVGPFLCPTLTAADLKRHIEPGKQFFETESFSVPNHPLKELAIQLASVEVMNTIIQLGSYDTIKCLVEWNLTTLRRNIWPV